MQNSVLSSKNRIDSSVSWYGSADGSFPLTNMATAKFPQVWRHTPGTTAADGHVSKFHFSLNPVARAGHLVFCRHNWGEGAQIRARVGTARLDVDFTDDAEVTSPYLTFGGGVNGTQTNEYGVMVAASCPRYEHDRRYYENGLLYSEDISQSAWATSSAGKIYPDGKTVDFPIADTHLFQALPGIYNDTYELKAQVRLLSGNGAFCFRVFNGVGFIVGATHTASTEWQWFSSSINSGAASSSSFFSLLKLAAAGVLQIRKLQIRRGASSQYRKTTTQRRYQRIGLVTEAGATNSLQRSSEFNSAPWTNSGLVVTANTATAPDGTVSMDTIATPGGTGTVFQNLSLGGTTQRAASVFFYAPASTSTLVALIIIWDGGGSLQHVRCNFNAATGAFISSPAVGATLRAAGVKDCGGGFYRAYVVGVGTHAPNTTVQTSIELSGAASQVVVWGAQNEATYVTTHIPTVGAAVTRTVDTAQIEPVTWVPYVWNGAEGTLYHEARPDEIGADAVREGSYVVASGAALNNIFSAMRSSPPDYFGFVQAGGTSYTSAAAPVTPGGTMRAAYRYRSNDWKFSVNGALLADAGGSSTAQSVPAITSVDLMRTPNATCYLRRVTIWPSGKSNSDLQALTTSGPSAIEYDSGWDDVMQMSFSGDVPTLWGQEYDVPKTFSERAVEWVRVGLYDPAKSSTTDKFECGRVFMGKLTLQPAVNPEVGLADGWIDRDTSTETEDAQEFFVERARPREVAFSMTLTLAEGRKMHEMLGSGGVVEETLYLSDPDDEADCQRFGFVGRMKKLDPLAYPLLERRGISVQIRKKR